PAHPAHHPRPRTRLAHTPTHPPRRRCRGAPTDPTRPAGPSHHPTRPHPGRHRPTLLTPGWNPLVPSHDIDVRHRCDLRGNRTAAAPAGTRVTIRRRGCDVVPTSSGAFTLMSGAHTNHPPRHGTQLRDGRRL